MKAPTRDPRIQAMLDERKRTMAEFTPNHRPLVILAIYRTDLEMDAEKLGTQVGHAYADALILAKTQHGPEIVQRYRGTGHGTKILMHGKNEHQITRAYFDALKAGLTTVVVIDRSHVMLPHFTGEPIVTAVGIGPVYKDQVEHITKRYSMIRRPPTESPAAANIATLASAVASA